MFSFRLLDWAVKVEPRAVESASPSLLLLSLLDAWQLRSGNGGVVAPPDRGFPCQSDWLELGGYVRLFFCFFFLRDQEFSL